MNTPAAPEPIEHVVAPRQLRLRYAGKCTQCGKSLLKGEQALYDSATRTVRCLVCDTPVPEVIEVVDNPGVAGQSAKREYERRKSARDARVKSRLGDILGGVVLAITDEPQSTRAWARGSTGEQKLAQALAGVTGIKLLHDRSVPGTKGNIDHIVVAPAGVFVIDAKHYKGLIQIRDVGGWLKTDSRLYVGRRDCSHLAENMGWQVEAIQRALLAGGFEPTLLITPVLCFVDGEWPLLFAPEEYKGVLLEGKRSIEKRVTGVPVLEPDVVACVHHTLAVAFPPK